MGSLSGSSCLSHIQPLNFLPKTTAAKNWDHIKHIVLVLYFRGCMHAKYQVNTISQWITSINWSHKCTTPRKKANIYGTSHFAQRQLSATEEYLVFLVEHPGEKKKEVWFPNRKYSQLSVTPQVAGSPGIIGPKGMTNLAMCKKRKITTLAKE